MNFSTTYQVGGYYAAFGGGTACTAIGFLYLTFFVKESIDTKPHRATIFRDMFNLTHIIDCIKTVLKKRDGYIRAKILILIILIFLCQFYTGEMSVTFLFLYSTFGFDIVDYSMYNTYR